MRLLQNISILILLIVGSVRVNAQTEPTINWLSFEHLSDSLDQNPKPVIIFFHTEWCSYCKKMINETFVNPEVIQKINSDYYAVKFDAESIEQVLFDGVIYSSESNKKITGKYHPIASILLGNKKDAVFPTTIFLNEDFSVRDKKISYLSIKQILKIL